MDNLCKIKTLKQLVFFLQKGVEHFNFDKLLHSIDFGLKKIEPLCFWNPEEYTIITIDKNENFELLLICWELGQEMPIHSHNTLDESWVYVIDGELIDKNYTQVNGGNTKFKQKTIIHKKSVHHIKDKDGVHQIKNTNTGRTVSLHLYVGKIGKINTYKEETKDIKITTLPQSQNN